MRHHFCHSHGGQKEWRISLGLSPKETNVTYTNISLPRSSHMTLPNLQEGAGKCRRVHRKMGEHKYAKIIENEEKFIKFKRVFTLR